MLKIKPDWVTYLHGVRRREIEWLFGGCPAGAFPRGLELGAGDGYQSQFIARYVVSLVVTDFGAQIMRRPAQTGLVYQVCDAERVDETFGPDEFDLIFSSNMMEHLPDPQRALAGMRRVLREDGLAIHIMPSPVWKLSQMVGFYPNAVLSRLERYSARLSAGSASPGQPAAGEAGWDNNPKVGQRRYRYLRRLLWPTPHGVSASNLAEFAVFRPDYWRAQFAQAGFRVAAVLRGPVSSGYGFGLDRLRGGLERLGLASEYAYITTRDGQTSPHLAHFTADKPTGF